MLRGIALRLDASNSGIRGSRERVTRVKRSETRRPAYQLIPGFRFAPSGYRLAFGLNAREVKIDLGSIS
jgi:hypothetical protein